MVLATEAFGKLVKITLGARKLSDAVAIVVKGNPEFLEEPATLELADRVFDEMVHRLTTGEGASDSLVA